MPWNHECAETEANRGRHLWVCVRYDTGGILAVHPGTSVPGSPFCDFVSRAFQPEFICLWFAVPALRRAADGSPRVCFFGYGVFVAV